MQVVRQVKLEKSTEKSKISWSRTDYNETTEKFKISRTNYTDTASVLMID